MSLIVEIYAKYCPVLSVKPIASLSGDWQFLKLMPIVKYTPLQKENKGIS